MSYFDHVRCSSCGAAFDPEQVGNRSGQFTCPYCGATLEVVSLFGIKDAFTEDDAPSLTLDHAVPGYGEGDEDGGGGLGPDVSYTAGPTEEHASDGRQLPARRGKGKGGQPSSLDVLKDLKKKK